MESIKINKLEIENVKRIKAVKIEPTANGLTIVGGNNNQGKTSSTERRIHNSADITYCIE